jgi:transcriptional regulator with XRE-family HTH domain
MEIDYGSIGLKVRKSRKHRGMTQEKLAESAGLSNVYISRIETGERSPSLSSLLKIAYSLDISLESLVDESPPCPSLPDEYRDFVELLADCNANERAQILMKATAVKKMLRGN